MEKIEIGKIVGAQGIKGEVKVYNYSDSPEVYQRIPAIWVEEKLVEIRNFRMQKNLVILQLDGVEDRNGAEALRGRELYITEADLPPLPEGQFYVRELLGMAVLEEDGTLLGQVRDVLQNTGQDLLEVEREDGKKLLIPKVDAFVKHIDGEKRQITVKLLEGMLEL